MSMKSINFKTGVKKYTLNGDESNCIEVNICDPNLLARLEKIDAEILAEFDKMNKFDEMEPSERSAIDQKIKDLIDEAFNADISSRVFGKTSCVTPLSDGSLYVQAFLDAFMPIVLADAEKSMREFSKNSAKKAEEYIKAAQSAES